ncbi:hypothetical protein [uncultured Roseobacter sp.]|uniref:hypothetical protein n=1 Tax=uncultured Roseobacter sp. TaxID=114847 RepID=UPI00262DA52C|nr:hypothetical protein [uncultured Roseobacter sp.]
MKNSVSLTASLAAAAVTAISVLAPNTSAAEEYNMCNWETIPTAVLNRIERRPDYNEILQRMFKYCPESALGLTDRPTASIGLGADPEEGDALDRSRGNGPSRTAGDPGGSTPGGGGGTPGGDGGTPGGDGDTPGGGGDNPDDPGGNGDNPGGGGVLPG